MKYLQFMFSSFWRFVGCAIIIVWISTCVLSLPIHFQKVALAFSCSK